MATIIDIEHFDEDGLVEIHATFVDTRVDARLLAADSARSTWPDLPKMAMERAGMRDEAKSDSR